MNIESSLYNSKLIKIAVEYMSTFFPDIDLSSILEKANINNFEIEDSGCWFNQYQCDSFYDELAIVTNDPRIGFKIGKFFPASKGVGPLIQIILGLLTPHALFMSLEKNYSKISLSSNVKVNNISKKNIEVIISPKEGIVQKEYQCQVTMGLFESIVKVFDNQSASVTHNKCIHCGDKNCVYDIVLQKRPDNFWGKAWKRSLIALPVAVIAICFSFPLQGVVFSISLILNYLLLIFCIRNCELKKNLVKIIETQRDSAQDILLNANKRNDHALLIKTISESFIKTRDIKEIAIAVIEAIEKYLSYEKAFILYKSGDTLVYEAGFGLGKTFEKDLEFKGISLSESGNLYVQTIFDKDTKIINFNESSNRFRNDDDFHTLLSIPIFNKNVCYGVLIVDNKNDDFDVSDLSFFYGITAQTALCLSDIISLNKMEDNEKEYRRLALKAQEDERKRIAYDLHDNVAQDLGVLKLNCDIAMSSNISMSEDVRKILSSFSQALKSSIGALRDIAYNLQPPELNHFGVEKVIKRYCLDFSNNTAIEVQFKHYGIKELCLPYEIKINIFRIVIEALNNIRKHSKSKTVSIVLRYDDFFLLLTIEDFGVGFYLSEKKLMSVEEKKMGLRSMEERSKLIGGVFEIESYRNYGTKIVVKIPWNNHSI